MRITSILLSLFCAFNVFAQEDYYLKILRTEKAISLGSSQAEVIVAVIDTGIDLKNKILKKHLWSQGSPHWDFVNEDSYPEDNHGHGTHISHLIVSQAPSARIVVLKYYDPSFPKNNTLEKSLLALRRAVDLDVDIINYSGGGSQFSKEEEQIIKEAQKKGILVVAAAGNDGHNIDLHPFYPASYKLDNILAVTSIDQNGKTFSSSNYGDQRIEIAAPGKSIKALVPGGQTEKMTGTSQATALVSGAAAHLISLRPELRKKPELIKQTLLAGSQFNEALAGKVKNQNQLDSYKPYFMYAHQLSIFGVNLENSSSLEQFQFADDKILFQDTQ